MRKKIEFLNRLFELLGCRTDILVWLKEEKLMSDDAVQTLLNENHATHAAKLASILAELQKADKLQLVDYEWTILPNELMKLTAVSRNTKKEWVYTT
jgi:hypothetical protein